MPVLGQLAPAVAPRRRGGARWFVAVLPGQAEERAPSLAAALGRSAYDARQILRRPAPTVIAHRDGEAAAAMATLLATSGIRAVRFAQADLDAVPAAITAVGLAVEGGGEDDPYRSAPARLVVESEGGTESLALSSVRLAVTGKVAREWVRERVRTTEDPLVGPFSGTSIRPVRSERLRVREYDDMMLLDLYREDAAPLRLCDTTTEVRGFGLERLERRATFLRFREWLKQRPSIRFDDNFAVAGVASIHQSDGGVEALESGWDSWSTRIWVLERITRERRRPHEEQA